MDRNSNNRCSNGSGRGSSTSSISSSSSSVGGGNNKHINFDSVLGCVATCVSELCHTSINILSPSFPAVSSQYCYINPLNTELNPICQ